MLGAFVSKWLHSSDIVIQECLSCIHYPCSRPNVYKTVHTALMFTEK